MRAIAEAFELGGKRPALADIPGHWRPNPLI
jgi:hypothetical protein